MRILMIPSFFQEKNRPTLGSFFLEQAIALQKEGHQVTICYADTYSVKYFRDFFHYEEKTQTTIEGVRILRDRVFCPLKHGLKGHKDSFYRVIDKLVQKECEKDSFDVIHAHCSMWAGYAAMKLSDKLQIPYVITEHSSGLKLDMDQLSEQEREQVALTYKKAAKVICVSSSLRKLVLPFRSEIEVVGNVVNDSLFQLPNNRKTSEHFCFFSLCHMYQADDMIRSKGIDLLLQAWKQIEKEYPQATLTIGGDGDAYPLVVQWIKELGLEGRVFLTGALSREETAAKMQECDCFVLPSRFETFGVVYIEAMACGKPVIAVKGTGPDDIVTPESGILLEKQELQELIHAMRVMIRENAKYDRDVIRAHAVEHFGEKQIAAQLEKIYCSSR